MPAPNYHACVVRDKADFQPDTFVTLERKHGTKIYQIIAGRLKGERTLTDHSFHYPVDVWTEKTARAHCKSHQGISFEPAAPPPAQGEAPSPEKEPHFGRAYQAVMGAPWAILPAALQDILSVVSRTTAEDIEALEARLGRPLDNTHSVSLRDGVAVIPVTGPIARYAGFFTRVSGATSTETLARDFSEAMTNPDARAILLNIDSPGGAANGIHELAAMIRAARDSGAKPIKAYVGGHGASAAYWIASAADEIIVDPSALLGSIGVIAAYTDDAGLQQKTGVKRIEIVSSGASRKRPDLTTDEGRGEIQRMVDSLESVFVDAVAANRDLARDQVLSHEGAILVGRDAIAGGLADRVGSLESTLSELSALTRRDTKGFNAMTEPLSAESLRADYPDVYEEVYNAGYTCGTDDAKVKAEADRASAAAAERARIESVFAQSMPGHEALVMSLAFDGVTSGPEAAMKVLAAEKQARDKGLRDFRADAVAPLAVTASNVVTMRLDAQTLLEGYIAAGKTRGEAIRLLASEHPEAHAAWVKQANERAG